MSQNSLDDLRRKIDHIDGKILDLLENRMDLVSEIQGLKMESGLDQQDPARERDILDRLADSARHLKREEIEKIWREILGKKGK